jgi:hypothetical protein
MPSIILGEQNSFCWVLRWWGGKGEGGVGGKGGGGGRREK